MADDERRDQVGELPHRVSPGKGRRQDPSSSSSESWSSGATASTSGSFSGPSSEEVNFYFYGLAGEPKLLARSSNDLFQRKYDGTFAIPKMVFNVGKHPIVGLYNLGPRAEIRNAIQSVKWIKVDIVRIGYANSAAQNPVVVLVTVDRGTVPFLKAQEAVRKCRQILQKYELDVHVEMMESEQFTLGLSADDPLPVYPYERIPSIGQSIGPSVKGPHQASGTLGLYVTVRNNNISPTRCALTCHHVVFPSGIQSPPGGYNKSFTVDSTNPALLMDQPSTQDHNATMKYMEENMQYQQGLVNDLLEKKKKAEEGLRAPLSQKQQSDMSIYQQQYQQHCKDLDSVKKFPRTLGSVFATSGIYTDIKHENTVDWALVKLDQKRFPNITPNLLPNFDLTPDQLRRINKKLKLQDWFNPQQLEPKLTSYVQFQEVQNSNVEDTDGFPSFRVIKYGRTTHWTVGVSNEVLSDCQRENGRISKEWCIIDEDTRRERAFSDRGDSGAIVFDFKGRIAGMIHGGGVLKASGKSMTYATPIEWLFESIEQALGVSLRLE